MKKFLFITAIATLLIGTAVDASAKVKKTKHNAKTTSINKSNKPKIVIDQGKYTQEGATRYANGDVADLEMAFIQELYVQYVYTGNIYNDSYFRYVSLKFTDEALNQLKDAEGNYDWTIITGRKNGSEGVTPANFFIRRHGEKGIMVRGANDFKCFFKVEGTEGAYKITQVSNQPVKM